MWYAQELKGMAGNYLYLFFLNFIINNSHMPSQTNSESIYYKFRVCIQSLIYFESYVMAFTITNNLHQHRLQHELRKYILEEWYSSIHWFVEYVPRCNEAVQTPH